MSQIIIMGADHAGVHLKDKLKNFLSEKGYDVIDVGTHTVDSVDYPDIASHAAAELKSKPEAFGVLVCGSGIGISIAANRFNHVRAALCTSPLEAKLSREHNNANVLCMGARIIGEGMAVAMLEAFIKTPFAGERHAKRVEKLSNLS